MANTQVKIDTKDFGEMTLAKIGPEGEVFFLSEIGKGTGKFGDYRVLMGNQDGEPFSLKVSSKRAIAALDERGDEIVGRTIKVTPKGSGMDKSYDIVTVD